MINIMSGPRFPIGQVFAWTGCLVWNFDIIFDSSQDITCPDVQPGIAEQAKTSHVTTSGPACGTYTRARQTRRPDPPGGGPPKLRSDSHLLGLPGIVWLFNLLVGIATADCALLAENKKQFHVGNT